MGAPLEAYEPNVFGYSHASGDVNFVDITMSIKYRLLRGLTERSMSADNRLYLAFTGRFAFYYDTRPSSPVVIKRLNPKLYLQHVFVAEPADPSAHYTVSQDASRALQPRTSASLAYAHESNGQTIDNAAAYEQAGKESTYPLAATEKVSRGWDYLELNLRHVLTESSTERVAVSSSFKGFLNDGLFEGHPQEVWPWEDTTQGKPRKQVDGLSAGAIFETSRLASRVLGELKLAATYTTGYQDIGRYNTFRVETGVQLFGIPLVGWYQRGYMTDLARYYLDIKTYGVGIEISGF